MATPVARSLFNNGKTSLRFIRASLLRPSDADTVRDQSLLAPIIIPGPCRFQSPSCTDMDKQVTASIPRLLGRMTTLVGGEDWMGLGRKYCLAAEDELEMRWHTGDLSEDEFRHKYSDSDDDDVGDFDVADFDDDGGDNDTDDKDDDVPPRKGSKGRK